MRGRDAFLRHGFVQLLADPFVRICPLHFEQLRVFLSHWAGKSVICCRMIVGLATRHGAFWP